MSMKKFIISSDQLKPALKTLGLAVNDKTSLPVTRNILCKVFDGKVEFISTDLEITISITCPAECPKHEYFELLLPFDYLWSIVSISPHAPFEIEHPSARRARIICENEEYAINSLEKVEEFPSIPKPIKEQTAIEQDAIDLLNKALLTVSKDELRPAMAKVLMDLGEKDSFIVSTDAHALFRQRINCELKTSEKVQFSPKMIKAMAGLTEVSLGWNEKKVCIKGENITIWCTRFTDQFPDYGAVIPALATYPPNLKISQSALVDALNKCCMSSMGTKRTDIDLKSEQGIITFTSNDEDLGRKNQIRKAAEYTGPVENLSINGAKMQVMMNQIEAENIQLHIHSATQAILITSEENENYLGLIMPIMS